MPLDGDGPSVRRPAGRIELCIGRRNQRCRRADLARGRVEHDQVPPSGRRLNRNERRSIARQIRIEQPRFERELSHASGRAVEHVEVAVQPGVAPQFLLVEHDRVAADARRRAKVPCGQPIRCRAVERQSRQRRELVRCPNGIDDLSRTFGARRQETRAGRDKTVVRQAARRVEARQRCGGGQGALVLAPQLAKRFAKHPLERSRTGKRHSAGRRGGQRSERVSAKSLGQVSMKSQPIRVRRQSVRPIRQAAVYAIQRLESSCASRLAEDRLEVARVEPSLASDHAFLVGGEPFDLPDR